MHRFKVLVATSCLTGAFLGTGVGEAFAQGRPSTLNMSCQQARSLVASRGAIVLSTGQFTYDRFVAHRGFCNFDEDTVATWAPTRDTPQCMVGYRCERRRDFFFDR